MTALGSRDGGGSSPRRVGPAAVLLACAALAAGALVAACGGEDGDPSSTATAATAESSIEGAGSTNADGASRDAGVESSDAIEIADFDYDPETISVAAGTEVNWTNADDAPHTATADDGSFDTGTLDRGNRGSATLDQPGTFTYYCRFHPFMKATVEVR